MTNRQWTYVVLTIDVKNVPRKIKKTLKNVARIKKKTFKNVE